MAIDEAMLAAASSFEDRLSGISERFVTLTIGGGRSVGVLARPLGAAKRIGWVQCHSFGAEQADLAVMEAVMARRLAAAGFPVLRFHCQGYGDSEDLTLQPGPTTHVRDTQDAVSAMPSLSGVQEVGLIGFRFGGTVAALVADRLASPFLVLVAPTVSGARYMSETLWSVMGAESIRHGGTGRGPSVPDLKARLTKEGMVDAKGLPLTREVFDEISAIDLVRQMSAFCGTALIVQVSATPNPQPQIQSLEARLGEVGATVSTAAVAHREASRFGMWHMNVRERGVMRDSQSNLYDEIARVVVEWCGGGAAKSAKERH